MKPKQSDKTKHEILCKCAEILLSNASSSTLMK